MYCISISYRTADIHIREKLAFSESVQQKILKQLCSDGTVSQCVILCTCSRTEVYFSGDSGRVLSALAEQSGISESLLIPYVRSYQEKNAVSHLFRVASGMHSMVIGEDEILGQTKQAYQNACACQTVGYELHRIFQAAIACAKKIKTETALSKSSVSTATLAANEAARLGKDVHVLMIGATGKIGTVTLKNLLSHKNISVTATKRRHSTDFQIQSDKISMIDYTERYQAIAYADCIISATASPHYTVTFHDLKNLSVTKPKLFIDLAVPPDIDSHIVQIPGMQYIGIDYFQKLAEEHNLLKISSAEDAKEIIEQEMDSLIKDFLFHEFLPYSGTVRKALQQKPDTMLYQLKSELNAEQFSSVLEIFKKAGDV